MADSYLSCPPPLAMKTACHARKMGRTALDPSLSRFTFLLFIVKQQLCAKQQKVAFLAWQLNIVLDFLLGSLASPQREAFPVSEAKLDALSREQRASTSPPPTRRDCIRALAQLLYDYGDRLGTRFNDILPPLLLLADTAAQDLESR